MNTNYSFDEVTKKLLKKTIMKSRNHYYNDLSFYEILHQIGRIEKILRTCPFRRKNRFLIRVRVGSRSFVIPGKRPSECPFNFKNKQSLFQTRMGKKLEKII